MDSNIKIAVIGLGYVGLPLLFSQNAVVGYDINQLVAALQSGSDSTFEVDEVTLQTLLVLPCDALVCIAPQM
jgi:UDP-N-acetyl-D-galactosamine dehydrogenase